MPWTKGRRPGPTRSTGSTRSLPVTGCSSSRPRRGSSSGPDRRPGGRGDTAAGEGGVELTDPRLTGRRVRLRPWRPDDAPALAAAWTDPEVRTHTLVPQPADVATATRWIAGWAVRAEHGHALDLVVSGLDDDAVRGEVGLGPIDWPRRTAEIGFWIGLPHRG